MLYNAQFNGCKINATGIRYPITTIVEGKDEEEARINLYDKYDHITFLKLTEIRKDETL